MHKQLKVLSLAIAVALTQQGVIAEAENDEKNDDNVVTIVSQKRVQDEVTVPISVSSIGAEDLQFNAASDLNDLSNLAPNFSTNNQEGYQSAIYMRGVGTWSRNIGFDTRVGVYLDGAYLGQSSALNQAMMGLEAAEIVRGPQGTLFGKNTVAGAVNLISMKPNTEAAEGRIGFEVGNFNRRQVSGRFNAPLGEDSAIQISFQDDSKDGEYYNYFNNTELGNRDSQAGRFQFIHKFDEQLNLYISYDESKSEGTWVQGEALSDTFGQFPVESDPLLALAAGPLVGQINEPYNVLTNVNSENGYNANGFNLTLEYNADNGGIFKSITAVRESDSLYINDTDYSPFSFLKIVFDDSYKTTTQEFQFVSADNKDFEYLGGIYYYDQKGQTQRDAIPGNDIGLLNSAFGLPCIGTVDITNPLSYCLEADKVVFNRGVVDVKSWAGYTNMSWGIGEASHIDFGIRYTTEKKEADYSLGTQDGGVNGIIFGVANGSVVDAFSDEFLSHNIGIRTVVGDTNYYAKWSTGFKSGGYNLDFIDQFALNDKARFNKETVNSYEVGMKGRYLDNALKFTAAVFYTKYDDYQVNQFLALGPNASTISIRNVPNATTKGIELGVDYRVNDNLSAEINLGVLSAEFNSFPGGGVRRPDGSNADASGNTMPFAPRNSISSAVTYETQVNADAIFVARLGWNYNSEQYTNPWNVTDYTVGVADPNSGFFVPTGTFPFGQIDSHNLYNLHIGLVSTEGSWDAFFWGKNITDEKYLSESFRDFFNTYTEQQADQRMYGVEINYYF